MAQRNTKQRELVLEAVRSRCDHPTAEQIYESVKAVDPSIGKSTVYRNLNVLSAQGEILQVAAPNGNHFDLRTDKHYHMQCDCCGEVVDVPMEYMDLPYPDIENATGYKVKGYQIMFRGICAKCAQTLESAC